MHRHYFFIAIINILLLTACQSNELSPEEIAIQDAADKRLSSLLFEQNLDNHASYNVHKDGSVIIHFDRNVSSESYTDIVQKLRAAPEISSVYAEQGGQQVCPLNSIRK